MTPNGPVLTTYSAKVYQASQTFPTTHLVARAIEILEQLSEPLRRETGSDSILEFPTLYDVGEKTDEIGSNHLNEFAEFCDVTPEDEEPFQFSEHQFRRLFAMMYYYRYENPDLSTLSWHLRHTDFNMTRKYITDADFQAAMNEIGLLFAQDVAGSDGYSGGMKDELTELVGSIEIQNEKRAKKIIAREGESSGFMLHMVPDGMCFGLTPNLEERSQCLFEGAVQLSSASRGTCLGCANLLSIKGDVAVSDIDDIVIPSESPILKAAKSDHLKCREAATEC
ncbi:integrase [Thalassotalea sp. PS06]|nr:integrase [Thalassotalea sp. PS06]